MGIEDGSFTVYHIETGIMDTNMQQIIRNSNEEVKKINSVQVVIDFDDPFFIEKLVKELLYQVCIKVKLMG